MNLNNCVKIYSSFLRSSNIERDKNKWLNDHPKYIHTPLGRSLMNRIIDGIKAEGNRSWTIVGPYGSGKSTFILALSQILCQSNNSLIKKLREEDPALTKLIKKHQKNTRPFLPVFITGQHGSITSAIYQSLINTLSAYSTVHPELNSLLQKLSKHDFSDTNSLCIFIEELSKTFTGGGLLLVVDELGKFLEYATSTDATADIYILQSIAEIAARSLKPVVFITVLHQAFENYTDYVSELQKEEFAKIQGRFESVAFQQPTEQIIRLLQEAIEFEGSWELIDSIRQEGKKLAETAWDLGLSPAAMDKPTFVDQISGCSPLHPATSLLLGPLFRKLAQNERSVFAFLSSNEPFGFQDYLRNTEINEENKIDFLTLNQLYDYISLAYGSSVYQTANGKKWAQVETSLDKLIDPSPNEVKIIKLLGLLSVIGDNGALRPTKSIIKYCLDFTDLDMKALDDLMKRSIIVFRSFSDSYRLWDGSDVDIEERLEKSCQSIDESQSIDLLLNELSPPRPIITRRHSYDTGTLRFFEVMYASPTDFSDILKHISKDADGKIVYALYENDNQKQHLIDLYLDSSATVDPLTVTVLIYYPPSRRLAALELKRLAWVRDNTPELSNDTVARRELYSRIAETENVLKSNVNNSLINGKTAIETLHCGQSKSFETLRCFNQYLSEICDAEFNRAPVLKNELINRRNISSTAAKARRDLLEAMITNESQPCLGITGHPPQLSMYLSLLFETGIHTNENGKWFFSPPPAGNKLAPLWNELQSYLVSAKGHKKPLVELHNRLMQPPFGLREGVVPVYVCAMLIERSLDVALFEQGTFVPQLTVPVIERLSKKPSNFEIRYCPIENIHKEIFRKLNDVGIGDVMSNSQLLGIIRPLCQFAAQLPSYSRNTRLLSSESISVRNVLLTAREPDKLLFEDLPRALSMLPHNENTQADNEWALNYASKLVNSLREINRAYPDLLDHLKTILSQVMSVRFTHIKEDLQNRLSNLEELIIEPQLKGFYIRLKEDYLKDAAWVESLATYICGKPPYSWVDIDVDNFKLNLTQISNSLKRLESLSYSLGKTSMRNDDVVRLGITTNKGYDVEKVLYFKNVDKKKIASIGAIVSNVLNEKLYDNTEMKLAVIAKLSQELLMDEQNEEELTKEGPV